MSEDIWVEDLEAELDALEGTPTSSEVMYVTDNYPATTGVGVAVRRAMQASGGGSSELDDLTDVVTAGGSEGDVLTQQGDGSFALEAPSGGGGSQPLQSQAITAAEITARWDVGQVAAAVELDEIDVSEGDVVIGYYEELGSTLDENVVFAAPVAYEAGETTNDILNNGTAFSGGPGPNSWAESSYAAYAAFSATTYVNKLKTGKTLYAQFSGDAAPTTGQVTVTLIVLRAA